MKKFEILPDGLMLLAILLTLFVLVEHFWRPFYRVGDCVTNPSFEVAQIIEVGSFDTYKMKDQYGVMFYWSRLNGGLTEVDCMGRIK